MIRGAVIAAFVLMMPAMALAERVSVGKGAMLRGLDKVTGVVEDLPRPRDAQLLHEAIPKHDRQT